MKTKHMRNLRWLELGLLILALIGPWACDRINVPAEYACETAVRLEGDFCGIPLSGLWILRMIVAVFL